MSHAWEERCLCAGSLTKQSGAWRGSCNYKQGPEGQHCTPMIICWNLFRNSAADSQAGAQTIKVTVLASFITTSMCACSTFYLAIWHLCSTQGLHPSRLQTWQTCSSLTLDTTAWGCIWLQANSMDQLAPLFATFGRTNRQNACMGSLPMQRWASGSSTSSLKPKVSPCSRVGSGWTAGCSASLSCCSRFICSATSMIIPTCSPDCRCSRSQGSGFTPSMSCCAHSTSSCCCAVPPVGLLTCTCPCSAAWSCSLAALKLPSKILLKAHGLLSRGD